MGINLAEKLPHLPLTTQKIHIFRTIHSLRGPNAEDLLCAQLLILYLNIGDMILMMTLAV